MKNDDPMPGIFRHFKGGLYRVFGTAWPAPMPLDGSSFFTYLYAVKHSETGDLVAVYYENAAGRYWTFGTPHNERLVIYQSQDNRSFWARPLNMFRDLVPVPESMGDQHEWRFDRVGD